MDQGVELRIELEKSHYAPGERVRLSLVVENKTRSMVAFHFRTGQHYDFAISTSQGSEIWRWSRGRMFAQVLTTLTIPAGETKRFEAVWTQVGNDAQPVPPGNYVISAWLATPDTLPAAMPVEIRIG